MGEIEIVCVTKGQQDFTLVVTVSADDVRKVNAVHVPPCHARHGAVSSRSIIVFGALAESTRRCFHFGTDAVPDQLYR